MDKEIPSKIKIKMGPIEIEYEGSEKFLKDELPELLQAVSSLYKDSGITLDNANTTEQPSATPTLKKGVQGTTSAIAGKLGCKSGSELIIAAAARLTFALDREIFSRQDILAEMKTASAYHKKTYVNNLSKYLNSLVKDQTLLETAKDTYALDAKTKHSLEAKLA